LTLEWKDFHSFEAWKNGLKNLHLWLAVVTQASFSCDGDLGLVIAGLRRARLCNSALGFAPGVMISGRTSASSLFATNAGFWR
jgi:hypothetical protein